MFVVPQQKLQRVVPRRQRDFRLGLGAAEMHMVQVARDLAIKRGKRDIDQQVMMPAIGLAGPAGESSMPERPISRSFCARPSRHRPARSKDTGTRRRGRPVFSTVTGSTLTWMTSENTGGWCGV